jgi:hypothetical protein
MPACATSSRPANPGWANSRRDRRSACSTCRATRPSTRCSSPLLTIVADTCGRHDTLGGACAHGEQHRALRAGEAPHAQLPRQLPAAAVPARRASATSATSAHNINFFMNVPVTPGGADVRDGISAPGKYVELRAEMDVIVLISNCPQLNNPCNAYNPTPIEVLIWNRAMEPHVQQGPDRQSRRHRLPHHPHAAPLGVGSVAVYSRPTRQPHVTEADEAWSLGEGGGRHELPGRERILAIAREGDGRRGDPPGYGFLSENAGFAERCAGRRHRLHRPHAGADARLSASSTPRARWRRPRRAAAARHGPAGRRLDEAGRGRAVGYPVMLKSTAGGGGIGMRVCATTRSWRAFDTRAPPGANNFKRRRRVPREIRRARPPHRGADLRRRPGQVIALGERDCSVQRRNQKVLEETPAPNLPAARRALHEAAVRLGQRGVLPLRGHGRIRLRQRHRRVLLPRGEHAPAGRARRHRGGVGRRPGRVDAAPGRGRAAAAAELAAASRRRPRDPGALYAEDPARDFRPSAPAC